MTREEFMYLWGDMLVQAFLDNMEKAKKCGALTGNEDTMILSKVVLKLTMENNFFLLSPDAKNLYNNLKHFI